jgi:ABC-type uncharacterized transport system involved in gliding motility auxiliary subunit
MNPRLKRLAPLGLYLSLAAAVAALGLFIVQRQFNLPLQIALGLVVIGIALFAILDPTRLRAALTGRQAKYGSNTLIMFIAFLGIVVILNYLVVNNSTRWDLTEDKTHTLTNETIATLNSLSAPVSAEAYFTSRSSTDTAKSLLEDYKSNSGGKFTYKFIDPEADPVSAQKAGITTDGTISLVMSDRREIVTSLTEQDMSSALVRLANPGKRAVYFLTGHGEHDITTAGDTAYTTARKTLESKNYTVSTLNLLEAPQIPDDALAIIICGPEKPVSADEVKLLKDYVAKGKSLFIMEDPTPVTQFGTSDDPLADYLKTDWGIQLDNDFVLDMSSSTSTQAISNQYGTHAITEKLQNMATIFPGARSIRIAQNQSGITATALVLTGQNSWGETDLTALTNNQATADNTKDIIGPVTVAVAAENTSTKARIVVVGNSTYAVDRNYAAYGNGDFFINSVDWAAQQDNLINLTPKTTTQRVMVSPKSYVVNLIFLGTVILLPLLVVFAGVLVWIQRRHRG